MFFKNAKKADPSIIYASVIKKQNKEKNRIDSVKRDLNDLNKSLIAMAQMR